MPNFNSKTILSLEDFNAITRVDKVSWSDQSFQCLVPGSTLPPSTTPGSGPTTTSGPTTQAPTTTPEPIPTEGTWNTIIAPPEVEFSNGNLTGNGYISLVRSLDSVSSGKWYWEITSTGNQYPVVGVVNANVTQSRLGDDEHGWGWYSAEALKSNDFVVEPYGTPIAPYFVIGIALDADNDTLTFYRNNGSMGVAFTDMVGPYFAAASGANGNTFTNYTANFGASAFTYAVPSGFSPGFGTAVGQYNNTTAPPTTTPANAINISYSWILTQSVGNPIAVGATRPVTLIVEGVNIGSSYNVELFTDMYSNTSFTEYPFTNNNTFQATTDPMEIPLFLSNEDFSQQVGFNTDPLKTNNFGRTIQFEIRANEISRPSNSYTSGIVSVAFANLRNFGVFTFSFGSNNYVANITWENGRIVVNQPNGLSLADMSVTIAERVAGIRKSLARVTANGTVSQLPQPYRYSDSPLSTFYIDTQNENGQVLFPPIRFPDITTLEFVPN